MDQDKILHLTDTIYNSLNPVHLRLAAISSQGLLSAEVRSRAWPIILSSQTSSWQVSNYTNNYSALIKCDVDRSLFGTDVSDAYSEREREAKRSELSELINTVIHKNPNLHYVQGFNYISTIFLMAAGAQSAYGLIEKCSYLFIRDFMRKDFNEGAIQYIKLVYSLLDLIDPAVSEKIKEVYTFDDELMVPDVILPWIICWFSSSLYKFEDICRVFDFCLATHPLAPIYLAVSIILDRRELVLLVEDMSEIHLVLRKIEDLDVEKTCSAAFVMMEKFPPYLLAEKHRDAFKPDSSVFNVNGFDKLLRRRSLEKKFSYGLFGFIFATTVVLLIN